MIGHNHFTIDNQRLTIIKQTKMSTNKYNDSVAVGKCVCKSVKKIEQKHDVDESGCKSVKKIEQKHDVDEGGYNPDKVVIWKKYSELCISHTFYIVKVLLETDNFIQFSHNEKTIILPKSSKELFFEGVVKNSQYVKK